ncbi:YceI family protein [Deinococcus soli (ex Cha et al. 2016)]|jgi:polyisoprenoid-binding protein YceI|uniref:Polyisoprenoid-binding protein YceI n=3 Tax=Deinococcus soli (ex Cha et al. 2016) TaxID=1309411 RepID=A0AAE4BLF5_9DEIO|nr:YceI family protein [Deinococcus soli (ex Cha et al. 2016)]MDR6217342.1 polyisoprenoid-binding protein YceI [Deinococcus soli (ex Cha et al. 2016)]MDR6326651.1 polyisoprenoid-binding protein YceI [Deinococcus soli (ex Cha et al. 2016)]MDR6750622.1 polyisoprenoid-binding protein YceI [Deinococcus soli (ex Cha et al. 2016)]
MKGHFMLGLTGAALLASGLAFAAPYAATAGTATFSHTVRFIPVRGSIAGVTASVNLDPANLAATTGSVTVPVVNLKTGIGLRDTHAKGAEALNTAKFPNATFKLEKLTGGKLVEGQTLSTTATGTLTVKGTAKNVSVPVKATLQGGKVNVSTQFKFNPFDFDVRYPGSSDSVTVDVAFVLNAG